MKNPIDELRPLALPELHAKFNECKKEYMFLLIQKNSGQTVKTHQFNVLKKTIARIRLLQSEKAAL